MQILIHSKDIAIILKQPYRARGYSHRDGSVGKVLPMQTGGPMF